MESLASAFCGAMAGNVSSADQDRTSKFIISNSEATLAKMSEKT